MRLDKRVESRVQRSVESLPRIAEIDLPNDLLLARLIPLSPAAMKLVQMIPLLLDEPSGFVPPSEITFLAAPCVLAFPFLLTVRIIDRPRPVQLAIHILLFAPAAIIVSDRPNLSH